MIEKATRSFERWLSTQTCIVRNDLLHKHAAMGNDVFSFLRATYYRWAQQFDGLDRSLSKAPVVLAVGDLHLENYGTWRDSLGRLAWGINDFDEAFPLPYTNDLLRLATSVLLVIDAAQLGLRYKSACRMILEGYREGLLAGGKPFVIGDYHRWFKPILQDPPRDPGRFWDKLRSHPRETGTISPAARAAIAKMMPDRGLPFEIRHRIAGLGNLGKPRYTAVADWNGGPVAREAKALTSSAVAWARDLRAKPYYQSIIAGAIRSPDPFLKVDGGWVVRRLAPDCRRIELASLIRVEDEEWLLHAMGFETANVHLGTVRSRKSIQKHLDEQPKGWLRDAAEMMLEVVQRDFFEWNELRR